MRFSSALISFLSSLSTTSVAMAMEEPHDSVLHDVTASILEESIEVEYKNKKSHLEPLKIQNSIDGRPNKANDVDLADEKDDIMQKKEIIHHLVDHQQHQDGKSFERCNTSRTTTATATATVTAAAFTSEDDSLMQRKISLDKKSIEKMDYGHLNRGTCSSPNDACVPQNKAIEGNSAFFKPEDASYASSGYCVPLSVLEDHLVDHQQHQDGKSFEECNTSPTTTTTTTTVTVTAAAAVTSEDDSLMKMKISLDKESFEKMDYGHLSRGTCSSPNDACVPQNKEIEGKRAFFEPEDESYASSGYCVPLSVLDDMEYKNAITTAMSLIDKEEFIKEEEMTDSYNHNHPQYDHHHRQLLDCASACNGERVDVSSYEGSFRSLTTCYANGVCTSYYPDISCWNTTGITDMSAAFFSNGASFNAPLECWDVGQVKDMSSMFRDATSFNQTIDSWDVSQVEVMAGMFAGATSFNKPIDSWNVSQVESMRLMFANAASFNQPIDLWDVSKVEDMFYMFFFSSSFNQCLFTWAEKTSDIVDTTRMLFATDCPNGIESPDQTIGPWCQNYTQGCFAPDCKSKCPGPRPDVSSYVNDDASSFQNLISNCYNGDNCPSHDDDIGCWNTTGITDMTAAFRASSFNAPLECWDVGKVTSMLRMFQDTTSFNQHIDSWNVSQVETITGMFANAASFNQPIDSWDVSQVTQMQSVFRYTSFNQSIDSWDVSQVASMQSMLRASDFNQCLSTWAEKTSDRVVTSSMLAATDCPDGIKSPDPKVGPWCQNLQQGCVASGFKPLTFKPLQQPSDPPSNKPTDVPTKPPTTSPQDSPTTKSQKKKSIKKTKKQVKKKSKKM